MRLSLSLLVIFVLAIVAPVFAQYADLTMQVDSAGLVTIQGETDLPDLKPGSYDQFTSKNGKFWILNITSTTPASFIYSITLPPGSVVNYVSGKNVRLLGDSASVVVRGSGEDIPLEVTVQYSIEQPELQKSIAWIPLAIAFVFLTSLWFIVRARRIRAKQTLASTEVGVETPSPNINYIDGLPERQQKIVALLRSAGGTLTQKQIEDSLKIPKSSVSRNVEALRQRGILQKGQVGMTNTVVLEDKYK